MTEWINVAAGFGVGVLVGLTGVGGGSLMTPILVLLFGFSPHVAVGTDLWFAAITKVVGGVVHGKRGGVDWQVLRRLFCGSIPAALLTLFWMHQTGADKSQGHAIVQMLGLMLVLTSIASLFRGKAHAAGQNFRRANKQTLKAIQPAATVAGGALLGFLVTFTSIGAGALGAVMLLYLYPSRMKPHLLVGTDIVHAIPLTMLAGLGHLLLGNVNFGLLGSLLLGSVPGIVLGALVSGFVPEKILKSMIAAILMIVGVKMLFI